MKRKETTHSEDLPYRASSSSTSLYVGDNEGGTKRPEGNDYEVFLSFRGKDTRKGFTDYLYDSLVNKGIRVFRDNNELRVGEEIGPELLCSIMKSKISIPIISENYASSKWCLQELAQMLKCRRSGGQVVLPIFYKVEPSEVQHLRERFGNAIDAHKKNLNQTVVKEWEDALKEVGLLKGWESEKIKDGHEAELVKMVVTRVMSELKRLFQLHVPKQLVGIDDRVEQIMSKIDARFNGTWFIGIYGMGGIGKTTLAKVLYNKLSSQFENRSFVANIRETSGQHEGIKRLQKQLIFDIMGSSWKGSNVDDEINILKNRFTNTKILTLLDDIDKDIHLNDLVGDGSWFEVGSIVIITTRDKSVLARANHLYELNELPLDQSLILFSRHAFRKDYPSSDYKDISSDVVSTTGGLPLALEVIGSFLCGKTKKAWIDTSKRLKKVPENKVQERLKISYDALDYEDQQIFLDIACFFIGESKQNPIYMWDACDFFPGRGIEVLSLMSLIKVDEHGKLMMHDQLRDLGREIVRREDQKEPQKRSRLWISKKFEDVLASNKGTSKIEAICLDDYDRESYQGEQFNELTNLRFLKVCNVNFIGDFQNLLPQLRWLDWKNCPSNFEMVNFHPEMLVVLDLSSSEISEDWGGWGPLKMATELKVLDLSHCKKLRRTPDLSTLKSLEILNLQECYSLEEIHPSIWYIKTLVSLDVHDCSKLEKLPTGVGGMEESRELLCYDKLAQRSESIGSSESLTKLDLSHSRIKELPKSIASMKALETLNASWCRNLDRIPDSICNLTSLSFLNLYFCRQLKEIPDLIKNLASLTELDLGRTSIRKLPESIVMLTKLQVLNVLGCINLQGLPNSIDKLVSLNKLYLVGSGIRDLPESISKLSSLQYLCVCNCKNLEKIPELPLSLTTLLVDFPVPSLPYLSKLTRLQELSLFNPSPPESLPELPVRLSKLHIECSSWPAGELRDLEKRLSELIREKSFGLREVTGSKWEGLHFYVYYIDEATNPTTAKSSEEGDPLFDEAASPGTPAVATSSEEGDPLSLSLSLSRPYKFRRPNPTIAKSSEEGDPLFDEATNPTIVKSSEGDPLSLSLSLSCGAYKNSS